MVELVMVLPVLMLLVLGSVELCRAFVVWGQLSSATSEGARVAIVSSSEDDPEGTVEDAVRAAAPNVDQTSLAVAVSSTWVAGEDVTVTSTMPFELKVMGVIDVTINLQADRTMRVAS